MADPITPVVSDRICKHMNDDHAEAVLTYAKVYGKSPTAETAAMSAIDPFGMDLTATVDGETVSLRVPFDRELTDSEDAHQVLLEPTPTYGHPCLDAHNWEETSQSMRRCLVGFFILGEPQNKTAAPRRGIKP
jgi:hypothetical protein